MRISDGNYYQAGMLNTKQQAQFSSRSQRRRDGQPNRGILAINIRKVAEKMRPGQVVEADLKGGIYQPMRVERIDGQYFHIATTPVPREDQKFYMLQLHRIDKNGTPYFTLFKSDTNKAIGDTFTGQTVNNTKTIIAMALGTVFKTLRGPVPQTQPNLARQNIKAYQSPETPLPEEKLPSPAPLGIYRPWEQTQRRKKAG